MAYYSEVDEVKNLHDLKREMFNLIVRQQDAKNPEREIAAATAYVQLARLQAELLGRLIAPKSDPPPAA